MAQQNPFEALMKACESLSNNLLSMWRWPSKPTASHGGVSSELALPDKGYVVKPLTKEELGRSTWTLLHTVAAQFPEKPTRQQKKDARELMAILSRLYPCKDCADNFKEILKTYPVQAESHAQFSQWLCDAHNIVNRSLGKPQFPCQRLDARWGKLECLDGGCDLEGNTDFPQ